MHFQATIVALCVTYAYAGYSPFGAGIIYGTWKGYSAESELDRWDNTSYAAIVGMGGTVTGASINWVAVQPTQGAAYNWTDVDRTVELASENGLSMMAYMGNTPDWALDPANKGLGYRFPPLPQYADDFSAFFKAAASRYCGKLHTEFWNEENGCSWENPGCSNGNMAPSYAPWLCRFYEAVKEGCPQMLVSVGGLDANSGVPPSALAQYIEDLYSSNASQCFDRVALHPYGTLSTGQCLHYDAITAIENVLASHNNSDRKLWINEYGWNSPDENTKAACIKESLTYLTKNPNIEAATYLSLTDLPNVPDGKPGYGLCSQNSTAETITPRASYTAFQAYPKQ